jgi:hypothetical protein
MWIDSFIVFLSIPAFTGEEKPSSRNGSRFPAVLGIAKRQGRGYSGS